MGIIIAGTVIIKTTFSIAFATGVGKGLGGGFEDGEGAAIGIIQVTVRHRATAVGQVDDRPLMIGVVVEETESRALDRQGLVSLIPVVVAGDKDVGALVLQHDVFPVIDVARDRAVDILFNPAAETIVFIGRGRGIREIIMAAISKLKPIRMLNIVPPKTNNWLSHLPSGSY